MPSPDILKQQDNNILHKSERNKNDFITNTSKMNTGLCICPLYDPDYCPSYEETSKYPFISAIIETIFEDSPSEYRLKCVGTNLNRHIILTSMECFEGNSRKKDHFLIKVGSDSWASKRSSFHTINHFASPSTERYGSNKSAVIIILNEKIPLLNTVSFAKLPDEETDLSKRDNLETYYWKSSFIHPLQERIKNERLVKSKVILTNCDSCSGNGKFCGIINSSVCSNYYFTSGLPLFHHETLVGIQISSFCVIYKKTYIGQREICFEDIRKYIPWIKLSNKFYQSFNDSVSKTMNIFRQNKTFEVENTEEKELIQVTEKINEENTSVQISDDEKKISNDNYNKFNDNVNNKAENTLNIPSIEKYETTTISSFIRYLDKLVEDDIKMQTKTTKITQKLVLKNDTNNSLTTKKMKTKVMVTVIPKELQTNERSISTSLQRKYKLADKLLKNNDLTGIRYNKESKGDLNVTEGYIIWTI